MEESKTTRRQANRNYFTELSAAGQAISEWRWNVFFDFTEILNSRKLRRGIAYQIERFISHFFQLYMHYILQI